MKVVILAGGFGTRLGGETAATPKPMIPIGGKPILWHIMRGYAVHSFREFVVACGFKADIIKRYFLHYYHLSGDISVDLRTGDASVSHSDLDDWLVHLIDTGLDTMTGGRLKRLESMLSDQTFMLTYGDGVSNVDLTKLLEFHKRMGKLVTLTAVRPASRFGGLSLEGEHVSVFTEKPQIGEGWINGGFMVMEPGVFEYLSADADVLEVDLLERLAGEGQLAAYRHEAFWQCMDTPRDMLQLERQWEGGSAPWMTWA